MILANAVAATTKQRPRTYRPNSARRSRRPWTTRMIRASAPTTRYTMMSFVNRKAPPTSPRIVVARPSRTRMIGKQIKPVRYGVDLTIGDRQPG